MGQSEGMEVTLPTCQHRGDPVTHTAPGSGAVSQRVECFMPLVRAREEVALVSPQQCEGCGYSDAIWSASGQQYSPPSVNHTPHDAFIERWTICDLCKYRAGNYCSRAPGTCTLTQKLVRVDFRCPQGNFEAVKQC